MEKFANIQVDREVKRQEIGAPEDAFLLLSVALMESMASGLPCAVSKICGNVDLIDEHGGAYFDPHSVESCRTAIEKLLSMDREAVCRHNSEKIKNFSIQVVIEKMNGLYGLS